MSENRHEHEGQIADKARQLFADSVAGLDGHTRSRLAQARSRAVAARHGGRSWMSPAQLVPLGGVAAAVLAAAIFWQGPAAPVAPVGTAALSDLDILLEGEDLDLFEDLEFYAWLLEQPELLELAAEQDDNG